MWLFFAVLALLTEQLSGSRLRERGGEWYAAKGPRPGLESRAAAVRTKPLCMGRLLYPLSWMAPREYVTLNRWSSVTWVWPQCWGSGGCWAWQRPAGCECSADTGAGPQGLVGPLPPAPSAPPPIAGTETEEGEALMTLEEKRGDTLTQTEPGETNLTYTIANMSLKNCLPSLINTSWGVHALIYRKQ